jgi:hypothetical protein
MAETILNTIGQLLKEFTPNPIPFDSPIKLDDPLSGAFEELRLNTERDKRDVRTKEALSRYREVRHYSNNISTLLYYFLYYLRNYQADKQVKWDFYSRLTLDLEKLLADTRSYLDSILNLVLPFSEDASAIPNKRKTSYGKFAEWSAQNRPKLNPPLSFMIELVPWGLTIRQIRDDYIHRGHEAQPFWATDEVYFNPYAWDRGLRRMPELFYPAEHPNRMRADPDKPLYLRKFIVYAVAPIFASEIVIGRYFDELFASTYNPWHRHSVGFPFRTGEHIESLHNFIVENKEVLEPEIYESQYFGKGTN